MQPLSGIKVLDFSTLLPGPLAGLLLAEAGAVRSGDSSFPALPVPVCSVLRRPESSLPCPALGQDMALIDGAEG